MKVMMYMMNVSNNSNSDVHNDNNNDKNNNTFCWVNMLQGRAPGDPATWWAAGEDMLVALGVRRWGFAPDLIAGALLPRRSPQQVQQRIAHMKHHNKAMNPIKVGPPPIKAKGSCCSRLQLLTY